RTSRTPAPGRPTPAPRGPRPHTPSSSPHVFASHNHPRSRDFRSRRKRSTWQTAPPVSTEVCPSMDWASWEGSSEPPRSPIPRKFAGAWGPEPKPDDDGLRPQAEVVRTFRPAERSHNMRGAGGMKRLWVKLVGFGLAALAGSAVADESRP